MSIRRLSFLFAFLFPLFSSAVETMKFQDAVKKKIILCQMQGTDSGHLGPCIKMYVANPTSRDLSLAFDVGMIIEPDSAKYQDMMITQDLLVSLPPYSRKNTYLYAMCVQRSDNSPGKNVSFRPKGMAQPALVEIGRVVADLRVQRTCGQTAVWCISDGGDTSGIRDDNKAVQRKLQLKTALILSKYVKPPSNAYVKSPSNAMEYEMVSFPCTLSYSLFKPTRVTIALYNKQNEILEVFVSDQKQQEGNHRYNIEVGGIRKHSGSRFMRLYLDGEKKQELTLEND